MIFSMLRIFFSRICSFPAQSRINLFRWFSFAIFSLTLKCWTRAKNDGKGESKTTINALFKLENFNAYTQTHIDFESLPFFVKKRGLIPFFLWMCVCVFVCNIDKTRFIDDIFDEESFRVTIQAKGVEFLLFY